MPVNEPSSLTARTLDSAKHVAAPSEEPVLAWLRSDDGSGPVMPSLTPLATSHAQLASRTSASEESKGTPPMRTPTDVLVADSCVNASAPHGADVSLSTSRNQASLDRFFEGLAAGESVDSLVHVLHDVMLVHYQKLVDDVEPSREEDAHRTFTHPLSASPAPSAIGTSTGTAASAVATTPSRPHHARRKAAPPFTKAVTAAMLFAVESPTASAEATNLYFSPPVHAVITEECDAATQRGPREKPRSLASPLAAALCRHVAFPALAVRPRVVRHLLSDRAASTLARDAWRRDRSLGPREDWCRALAILSEAQPSRETASTWVELHCRAGEWQRALHILERYVPPGEWGQRELSACVRGMHHAARAQSRAAARTAKQSEHVMASTRRGARSGRSSTATPTALFESDAAVCYPVELLARAARAREQRLVDAASCWDTAALAPRGGEETLDIVHGTQHALVDSHVSTTVPLHPDTYARMKEHTLPSAVNDALGLLSLRPDLWREACRVLDDFVLLPEPTGSACEVHANGAVGLRELAWRIVPNAVTVHQTCLALRADWRVALRYASRILRDHPDLTLLGDSRAVESYLEACLCGRQWRQALTVIQRHTRVPTGDDRSTAVSQNDTEPTAASDSMLPVDVSMLLRVIDLFNEQQATKVLSAQLATQLAYSKHYNKHTRSRALNALVQHSTTAAEAEEHSKRLHALSEVPRAQRPLRTPESPVDASTCAYSGLENESLVRLVHLYSHEGAWMKSLQTLHVLLHDPQRQASYFPTAQTHDEVQFALSQAAAPGPPWSVALRLFWTMCEDRNVPVSAMAFRAVAARCQAQGATSQYEQLLRFLVKRGVKR